MSEPLERFRELLDYTRTLDCIHCGLCLRTCPTYQLTGQENASPRGRIHLMRAVAEERLSPDRSFADEMQFCLLCRHCESVCPSGVHFGPLMESARAALEQARPGPAPRRLLRWIGFRQVLPQAAVLSLLAFGLALGQRSGLLRLLARLFGRRGRWLDAAAPLPPAQERRRLAPEHPPALRPGLRAPEQPELLFLEGCVMPLWFGRVNRAAVRSLQALGHRIVLPKDVVCCGSLHAHNGDAEGARELAKRLIFGVEDSGPGALIVPSAGCSAHLKELSNLFAPDDPWHARAAAVARRTSDYAEFIGPALARAGFPAAAGAPPASGDAAASDSSSASINTATSANFANSANSAASATSADRAAAASLTTRNAPAVPSGPHRSGSAPASARPSNPPRLRVAWDDPCHLCHGQQVRQQPRQALDLLPGIQRIALEDSESCCGSAGIYSLLRPDASAEIFAAKAHSFQASGADALVTANPGCHLQFLQGFERHGIEAPVYHLAELVDRALPP
jgi:glycolate oxidase iron-sulfur subunit